MKRLSLPLSLALLLNGLGPILPTDSAMAQADESAWIVRADAAWTPGAGWRDVTTPELAALGVHRIVPVAAGETGQAFTLDPAVQLAQPETTVSALDQTVAPNDAAWSLQYAPEQIQTLEAWQVAAGCAVSVLAVIDSGLDFTHPDLAGRYWTNAGETGGGRETNGIDDDGNGYIDDWRGWDFVGHDNNPSDDYGHGTHVAGIANAAANNGIGIAGVAGAAWGVKVMALKVLDSSGLGLDSSAAEAIKYAVDNGARVINLSLGDPLPTPAIVRHFGARGSPVAAHAR